MTALWQAFQASLAAGGIAAIPLALLGGVVSGLNPCCLAFYPAVTATCCVSASTRSPGLGGLVAFVAGIASATTLAGVSAALAGHAVLVLGRGPRYALAFVPLLMALHLLGWLRLPLPTAPRPPSVLSTGGAFVAGALLSLVLGACGTPVFAAALSYAALTGSVWFGAALLFAYGIGSGLPLLLAGVGAGQLARRANSGGWQSRLERAAAALLLAFGFYLLATT